MKTYEYTVFGEANRHVFASAYVPDSTWWLAEDAAEDFYNNRDGWECKWPIRFDIYNGEKWLGAHEVHLEMKPSFTAFDIVEAA